MKRSGSRRAAVAVVDRLAMIPQERNVFNVTPFVAVVTPETPLVVDLNEASAAYRVPLAAIVASGAVHRGIEVRADLRIATWQFDYGTMHVWGLTGTILNAFTRRYHALGSPLRAALDERLLH